MKQRLIDAEALKAELTGRIALPDWVLTAVLHIIENAPTVTPDMAQVLAYESVKINAERPTEDELIKAFELLKVHYKDRVGY